MNPATDTVYVADAASGRVDVYGPREHQPPTIDRMSAREVTAESAGLEAQIDTDGSSGSYYFEYGTAPCSSDPSACTRVVGLPASLGGAYGDQSVEASSREGTSAPVLPATTYHYRLHVSTGAGSADSVELTFTTSPPAGGRFIADERSWELVSPAEQDGFDVLPVGLTAPGVIQAAQDGGAIAYIASGPFAQPEGNRSVEPTQILSTRTTTGGWSSKDIITPNSAGPGLSLGADQEYEFFSPDLSLALLRPFNEGGSLAAPPLSPPASEAEIGHQEKTIYLRDDQPIAPRGEAETQLYDQTRSNGVSMGNPGYLALVTAANAPGTEFGGVRVLQFAAATPDLSHVVVESAVALKPGLKSESGCYGLYEWSGGTLQLVSVLPDGSFVPCAELGVGYLGSGRNLSHAISNDGARVFFTYDSHLYMRDMTAEKTIQLDTLQKEASGTGPSEPRFQTAGADGSRVFFTDTQRLTPDSGASEGQPDLYEFETSSAEGQSPAGTLRDLTPHEEGHPGEAAGVQGDVLGAGEDGSVVYFVADGVLSNCENAQGTLGDCENAQGEATTPGDCGRRHGKAIRTRSAISTWRVTVANRGTSGACASSPRSQRQGRT